MKSKDKDRSIGNKRGTFAASLIFTCGNIIMNKFVAVSDEQTNSLIFTYQDEMDKFLNTHSSGGNKTNSLKDTNYQN